MLLSIFGDVYLLLSKLSCLQELARRDQWMALLQQLCSQKSSHPVFWQQYAQVLSDDAREYNKAIHLLRRAIRFMPTDADNFYTLANILWYQRHFQEAFELYRFATCINDKDHKFAFAYFSAARYFKQTEAAILLLGQRFQRFGKQSPQPAQTLFWAYSQVERMGEAFAVLETAFELRPDDGELLLYTAKVYASNGNFDRAATLLDKAKDKAPYASWLRTAASLALYRGELVTALELWQRIVETQPLAMDANRSVARLLAETKGNVTALEFLQQACDRFPHSYALHQLWSQWLYDEDPTLAEPVLRHLIEINSVDAWTHRQLALVLGKQRRFEDAFLQADIAYQLYPHSPSYYCVYGSLCVWAGLLAEAKNAYREAIRLSVDTDGAISQLLSICDSKEERHEALNFVYQELVRQVIFGDGLLAYWEQARYVLEADELLTKLRAALEARPDLWHAWSAMIRQLGEMNQLDEALELAQQGTERFPLLPRMWLDLSWVYRSRQDQEGEIKVLIAPSDAIAWGYRGDAKLRTDDRAGAKADFRRAIELKPDYSFVGLCLFDEQLADNELDEAAQTLELLRTHVAGEFVLAREVQLAAVFGNESTATQCLRQLCLSQSDEYWPIEAVTKAMREAGWIGAAEQVFNKALESPNVNPQVATLWVKCCVALEHWQPCQMRLNALHQHGKVGQRAIATYVDALARAGQTQRLYRYINSARQSLRDDSYTWGSVGWALLTASEFHGVIPFH